MFPIGDSPNPRGLAWVTLALIAINVLVFVWLMPEMDRPADPKDPRLLEYIEVLQAEGRLEGVDPATLAGQISEYDLTVFEHGSRPAQWTWLSMLTSMFLHGGFMHLFGNMLFLWIYGNNCEHRLGRFAYLVVYLATGFAASFGDIALRPDSNIPGVGASGAISGVLGLYFIWVPKNTVRLLILLPPAFRRVDLGARWVLGFYIVVQNIVPALMGGGGGVAHGAHIGGFVAGAAVALVLNWRMKAWPADAPEVPALETHEKPLLQYGAEHEQVGDAHGALAAYERAVRRAAPGRSRAAAHLGAARVLSAQLDQPALAYQHLVAALRSGPSDEQVAEARRILAQIRGQVGTVPLRFA